MEIASHFCEYHPVFVNLPPFAEDIKKPGESSKPLPKNTLKVLPATLIFQSLLVKLIFIYQQYSTENWKFEEKIPFRAKRLPVRAKL